MTNNTQNKLSAACGTSWLYQPSGHRTICGTFYLEDNMQEKKCSKCGEVKEVSEFYKNNKYVDGFASWCKQCHAIAKTLWVKNNIEKSREASRRCYHKHSQEYNKISKQYRDANPLKRKETARKWYENNTDRALAYSRNWRANNQEKVKEMHKSWVKENHEKWREIGRRYESKINEKPRRRLSRNISCMINKSLNGSKASRHWETLVGYTVDQLKGHLERQFKPGMNWENRSQWHIDHIIPLSVHNFQSPEDIDFKKAWSLKNLQPMWAKENISKSNKLSKPFQPSLTI